MKTLRAIKTENKNGTFNYTLENGEEIIKNTKRNYNAFALSYYINNPTKLNRISPSSKGADVVIAEALRRGFSLDEFFVATV
jgi:hypothetical protein